MRRDVFQAIADPTRREIIRLIAQKPLPLNSIAENFDISRPAISKHIRILTECGIVMIHTRGRERYCEAQLQKLTEVSQWVDYFKTFWNQKLDALGEFLVTQAEAKPARKAAPGATAQTRKAAAPGNKPLKKKTKHMEKAQVVIERTYNAPVEKVWKAITDIDQMKQWYMPALTSFQPTVGFETGFSIGKPGGKQWPHLWKITEVIPNKKISYEWRYEGFPGNSLVTFELSPVGDTTLLKLSHIGLETFEGDKNPGLEPHNFAEGWNQLINILLKDFVEKIPS